MDEILNLIESVSEGFPSYSFYQYITHITCKEGTFLIIIIFRNRLKMQDHFSNSVCLLAEFVRVQCYRLLTVIGNIEAI